MATVEIQMRAPGGLHDAEAPSWRLLVPGGAPASVLRRYSPVLESGARYPRRTDLTQLA